MTWNANSVLIPERTGAWQDWTPNFTDLTPGTGSSTLARYTRAGDIVVMRLRLTLGNSFAFGTDPRCGFPITPATYANRQAMGSVVFHDTSAALAFAGVAQYRDDGTFRFRWPNPSNSNRLDVPTSSVPFSWQAGDFIYAEMVYEGA